MPSASSCVLIGGYTLRSEPVTRNPAAFAIAAMPPMKVPAMPSMWMWALFGIRQQRLFEQHPQQQVAHAHRNPEHQVGAQRGAPDMRAGEHVPNQRNQP